jgi:hypothetical protein
MTMPPKRNSLLIFYCKWRQFFVCLLPIVLIIGCGGKAKVVPAQPEARREGLLRMGYSIQIGAFSKLYNAIRLSETLQDYGLRAYYFVHSSGLYKVRFGNLPSKERAKQHAETLRSEGIIHEYYIVGPDDYPTAKISKNGKTYLRNEIVEMAKSFIGIPYRWGGSSAKDGFDCSGFTMAVYQLNGLNLPRSSTAQWRVGSLVKRDQLSKADLVFFATTGESRISHVGIYIGEDRFIHAPGRGKRVRIASLSKTYFRRRYMGAKNYF